MSLELLDQLLLSLTRSNKFYKELDNSIDWSLYRTDNFPKLKNKRILNVIFDNEIDNIPIWIHRQAGRYMKEFRDLRQQYDFFTICSSPSLVCQVTLQPINKFDLDAAIIFSDILVIPPILGLECIMVKGKGPVFPNPLTLPDDRNLDRINLNITNDEIKTKLDYVYKSIILTRHKLKGKVPLIGFCGGPFTLLCYTIEGGGSKTYFKTRSYFYKNPKWIKRILDLYTRCIIQHLINQANSGAQLLEIFESNSGFLSIDLFKQFIIPLLNKIYIQVKKHVKNKDIPIILFPRQSRLCWKQLLSIGYQVISLDWSLDPKYMCDVKRKFSSNVVFQGNLDPCVLYGDKKCIQENVFKMLDDFELKKNSFKGLIVNLGHGMLPTMKPKSVNYFIQAVRDYYKIYSKSSN